MSAADVVSGHDTPGAASAVRRAVARVLDPELSTVTIEELGILRDVRVAPGTGRVAVTIRPTYSGCPAMDTIRADIRAAARAAGYPDVEVHTVLSPAWSTDDISESGRAKLAAAGIAPPGPAGTVPSGPAGVTLPGPAGTGPPGSSAAGGGPGPVRSAVRLTLTVRCPRCGAPDTEQISRFGATACKALWRCRACAEPFEHLKAL